MKCCINSGNFIRLLFLLTELFKFEIRKCGQILCAHKPYFLMPGHIYRVTHMWEPYVSEKLHESGIDYDQHTMTVYSNE